MGKREHIYKIIAENIRKERRRLGITQAELAERADVSLDTIKSVENGRRAMSLDTYLNIVHALESSPTVLMSQQHPEKHIERFAFMMNRCDEREIEFALHMIEQILRGHQDVEFAYKLEEHEFKINGAITYQQADNSYTNRSEEHTSELQSQR